jgi:hypothetical protein
MSDMSDALSTTTVQIQQLDGPFNGTSAQAADWIRQHDRQLRSIAADVSKVIVYFSQKPAAGTSGVTLSFYEYKDLPKGRIGTILELTETGTGYGIYVIWTNEAIGDDAIFYNDAGKTRLDVSLSLRRRKYGMSNDTLKHIRKVVREI